MTTLDQAHHAGFMEGIELVQKIVKDHLLLSDIFGALPNDDFLKGIEDQVALAIAARMEDV